MSGDRWDDEAAMDEVPRSDPLVQELVEQALAPYVRVAPPALLEVMRDVIEESLTTDPYPVALLRRLRAERAGDAGGESGTLVRGGAVAEAGPPGESCEVVRGGADEDAGGRRRSGSGEGA